MGGCESTITIKCRVRCGCSAITGLLVSIQTCVVLLDAKKPRGIIHNTSHPVLMKIRGGKGAAMASYLQKSEEGIMS